MTRADPDRFLQQEHEGLIAWSMVCFLPIRLIAKTAIRRQIPVSERRCSVGVLFDDSAQHRSAPCCASLGASLRIVPRRRADSPGRMIGNQPDRQALFKRIPELIVAIEEYIGVHNKDPEPFVRAAKAKDILPEVICANRRLGSLVLRKTKPYTSSSSCRVRELSSRPEPAENR